MTSPKILFIGGTHPRHLYYANQIHERYPLAGAVLQNRGELIPKPPSSLMNLKPRFSDLKEKDILLSMWVGHFINRDKAEKKYFGEQKVPLTPNNLFIAGEIDFLSASVLEVVKKVDPDIVLIFGCGMIKGELAEALPELTINLHLGLSPRYRGAATLFWPFYFLEPQWAGCTFHKIVDEPDAGDILHQCVPELERGDKIHDVACKAVVKATREMIKLLGMWDKRNMLVFYDSSGNAIGADVGTGWQFYPQSTTGKNFLSRDFQVSHLRMIYETYNDDIVDQYLVGNLKQHKPKLVRQF